jgi:hypothetical protein
VHEPIDHSKPTRIAIRFTEDGERLRVSKKTGAIIPKPEVLKERQTPRRTGKYLRVISFLLFVPETGPLDTAPEDVLERSVDEAEVMRIKSP